jgi:hypothetical protein
VWFNRTKIAQCTGCWFDRIVERLSAWMTYKELETANNWEVTFMNSWNLKVSHWINSFPMFIDTKKFHRCVQNGRLMLHLIEQTEFFAAEVITVCRQLVAVFSFKVLPMLSFTRKSEIRFGPHNEIQKKLNLSVCVSLHIRFSESNKIFAIGWWFHKNTSTRNIHQNPKLKNLN